MDDEYDEMTSSGKSYVHPRPFPLDLGGVLPQATLQYNTYGTMNSSRSNVLLVCHALTGNSALHSWWGGLLGPDLPFDTTRFFVVCANILGSCYGSTGPTTARPGGGGAPYGRAFPKLTVRDTVRLTTHLLRDELKVSSVACVIGGSFGGMQALEFLAADALGELGGAEGPEPGAEKGGERPRNSNLFFKSGALLACNAKHSAWQIAISEVQRMAIMQDPTWGDDSSAGKDSIVENKGLSIARMMAMITYRSPKAYDVKFGRRKQVTTTTTTTTSDAEGKTTTTTTTTTTDLEEGENTLSFTPSISSSSEPPSSSSSSSVANWSVGNYLAYQGSKFLSRFDPLTYLTLTETLDSHDVGRNRAGGVSGVLSLISCPVVVVGISSDSLYPVYEQRELFEQLGGGEGTKEFVEIHSDAGHDGFLLEQDEVGAAVRKLLGRVSWGGE